MIPGKLNGIYCNSLTNYSRYVTREVKVGNIGIGGSNPIRVQSMTTTDTMDTKATVEQSIRMIKAGCELVRITAPSINEAKNLEVIKKELRSRGYDVPLVADIHFTPNAAEMAARIVEKVRINPGNYADKKKFETLDYTDQAYEAELERIRERFLPLIKICKEYGTAMRIGTNHGSLSDRILSRYGDTPLGMVESAFEFLRICEDEGYQEIVLSMKASNPQVMVQAYRLLIVKMTEAGMNYPLHLGVTEAGEAEDGRIKSAVGIGTLLEDGIGDTIRVSLTEEPEFEIPVALALLENIKDRETLQRPVRDIEFNFGINAQSYNHAVATETLVQPRVILTETDLLPLPYSPFEYSRRHSNPVMNFGGSHTPVVIIDFSRIEKISPGSLLSAGYSYSSTLDKWNIGDQACDFIRSNKPVDFEIPGTLGVILDAEVWMKTDHKDRHYPLFNIRDYFLTTNHSDKLNFISIKLEDLDWGTESDNNIVLFDKLGGEKNIVLVLDTNNGHGMAEQRRVFVGLMEKGIDCPVIIRRKYSSRDEQKLLLNAASDIGSLFLDGMGDGIWIEGGLSDIQFINSVSFGILQATRTRISKTEYISCPSCGRTLFDLQETTAKIRARTDHLKGLKIGIMGCIVNGPGEMADADYGYVGTGPGKITLYKGKEVVKRNVDATDAVDALIDLIREHGDWVELK